MQDELPNGWVKTTLGEIVEPSRVHALPGETSSLRYVGLEHIEPQTMKLIGYGYARDTRSSSLRFSEGDILYAKMRPYLNKVWVAEFKGVCSTEFLVFPKSAAVDSYFLAARLNAHDFVAFANSQVSGERPRVNFEKLARFPLLLPPTAEQERIANKLRTAFSGIRQAEIAAQRAQARLESYRSAIVKSAITGDLSHAWRERNREKGEKFETGSSLLQRIVAARRARWEESELQRLRLNGKKRKNDEWKLRYREPTLPRRTNLPSLPEGWVWASLDELGELDRGKSRHRPRDDPRLYGGPYPFIQTGDIRKSRGTIRKHTQTYSEFGLKQSRLWPTGTLCITIAANIAETGILSYPACFPDSVVGFIQDESLLKVRFVEFFIRSEKANLQRYAPATAQKNINLALLRQLAVPLPPLAEQSEIVRLAEHRLAAADQLNSALGRQFTSGNVTRQSLLKDAFAGKLLRQRRSDAAASGIFDQIRVERQRRRAHRKNRPRGGARSPKLISTIRKPMITPQALNAAFSKIGRRPDARRLFDEVRGDVDNVANFYETLRATPQVRTAFEKQSGKQRFRRKARSDTMSKGDARRKGYFRLSELWLEDFKNLKDYSLRFDSTHALDVMLGWNGTGKSNLFEALVIIFRDLHQWCERDRWPKQPMKAYRLRYWIDQQLIEILWEPNAAKRPLMRAVHRSEENTELEKFDPVDRKNLRLPRFIFGYYSGPTNRLCEHFEPMNQEHYNRLRTARSDDPKTLAALLEKRRFFCAETHHAKYVLLAFCYKEDPAISRFLEERLRITQFESALFVIRKPRWARKGSKADSFWGAEGVMKRVMERLREFAIAPMVVEQTIKEGYRTRSEDHYYFYVPDLDRLHAFAAEYESARTFFLALESTDFSELIHDVKIQVRVKTSETEGAAITFREMSEGEQQLLMVLGLLRFTKSHQSLVLLDEPDTHLNPQWSVDYLKLLTRVMSEVASESEEQQTSQILISTHDPLVIASLVKEQIHLLKRAGNTLQCYWERPKEDPRGLGFTGILVSDIFGFRSDLDEETLTLLDRQVALSAEKKPLTQAQRLQLTELNKEIERLGFKTVSSDPYYRAFIEALARQKEVLAVLQKPLQTPSDKLRIRAAADRILAELSRKHELKS